MLRYATALTVVLATGCLAFGAEAATQQAAASPASVADNASFAAFEKFCSESFGAEKEELVYQAFGKELKFQDDGNYVYPSVNSACVGFETVLPAKAYVEYGPTDKYGAKTVLGERFFYLHLAYLKDLKAGTEYHYRLVATDERGKTITSADRTFKTLAADNVIRVPEDVKGPVYVLDKPGATYIVTKDLTVDGRAFEVKAADVTLDLGGHTVVYDNVHMGPPASAGEYPKFIAQSAFGVITSKPKFRIVNGTIRQGAGNDGTQTNSIGFSPVYTSGEGGEIAGLTLDYTGDQMSGICTHWVRTMEIHHNVIRDRGDVITNRHQGCDAIGHPEQGKVHHNLVERCRHRGLGGKEVYDNEIYGDSWDTNSFGVCVINGGKYHGNRVHGTGYHFVAFGWATGIEVYGNFIHLQGNKPNKRSHEYGDQESGNGIRVTQYQTAKIPFENLLYHDNTIVVKGKYGCQMRGVQFFSDPYVKNLVFRNNTVKAIVQDADTKQASCITTQGNADRTDKMLPIRYEDNTFISNFLLVRFGDYYGVGSNHQFIRCKFIRVGDDKRFQTFFYETAAACKGHVLLDCTFEAGGAKADDVTYGDKAVKPADADYTVQWTLTVKTAPNAAVIITDKAGKEVFSGKADGKGAASAPLSQFTMRPDGKTELTPHTVTVESNGKTASKSVTMDKKQEIEVKP